MPTRPGYTRDVRLVRIQAGLLLVAACGGAPPAQPPPQPAPPAPAPAPPLPPPAAEAAPHTLAIWIKPLLADGEVDRLEVSLRFSEPPGEFGEPRPLVLSMPEREEDEGGWPDAVEEVSARDAEGALGLVRQPSKDGAAAWRSDRRPLGAVSVRYQVKLARGEQGRFMGTRAQAGGFEGTGATFLLLPETADTYHLRLAWDLGALGATARAVSSFGAGETEAQTTMDRLGGAVFMAGPIGRLSVDDGAARFEGAWLGRAGFDPVEAMAWAARVRTRERAFFHDANTAPYGFFLRAVRGLGPTWVGEGKTGGFHLVVGEELGFTRPARFAIAHELVHDWIGGAEHGLRFAGPEGSAYWFSEGFTVHFTRAILLRAGLCTAEEFADDLRERTERYVINPERDVSNEVITKRYWENHDVQNLPYDRGMLYAADVDAAVRAKSGGKRSLDDLVLGLLEKARALGHDGNTAPLPTDTWRNLVGAELGPEAQARFDAVIGRGEPFTPPAGAYGPCFKAVKKQIPRWELGFTWKSLVDSKIQGLVRNSAAERAGLREGDVLVSRKATLGATEQPVDLVVKRGDTEKKVSFFPRGKPVEATEWVRDPGVPAAKCAR
jgi:predicted metalloprotease with PDZ domain